MGRSETMISDAVDNADVHMRSESYRELLNLIHNIMKEREDKIWEIIRQLELKGPNRSDKCSRELLARDLRATLVT